jgi:hypothetical protein
MKSWDAIHGLIQEKYPPSVLLIRDKMKRVLGFTTRTHQEWFHRNAESKNLGYGTMYYETYMHLDFYDEPKRTMFLLKYCDYIEIGKTET